MRTPAAESPATPTMNDREWLIRGPGNGWLVDLEMPDARPTCRLLCGRGAASHAAEVPPITPSWRSQSRGRDGMGWDGMGWDGTGGACKECSGMLWARRTKFQAGVASHAAEVPGRDGMGRAASHAAEVPGRDGMGRDEM